MEEWSSLSTLNHLWSDAKYLQGKVVSVIGMQWPHLLIFEKLQVCKTLANYFKWSEKVLMGKAAR